MSVEDSDALLEVSKQAWSEQERALRLDISALQWVEDLEQRVVGADLQLKVKETHSKGISSFIERITAL